MRGGVYSFYSLSFVCCAQFGERWWYRHTCAVGGVFNILMMMGANLVGFVVGPDGTKYLGYQLVSSWSGGFLPPDVPSCHSLMMYMHRSSFPPCRMCLSICWRTAHVRVPVCSFVYASELPLIALLD